ncbi:MAG: hypothetical protein ABI353_18395 [Isosphaeraceae bacterium]
MVRLYLETNFLVGYAMGRETKADLLLSTSRIPSVSLAIPSICFFEAGVWREGEIKRRHQLDRTMRDQITQLMRDLVSPFASSLRSHLHQARDANDSYFRSIDLRLSQVFEQLSRNIEWIGLSPEALNECRTTPRIGEMTDDLILSCILEHARSHREGHKAFLSGNTQDFGRQEIREALRESGVDRFFTTTHDALGWLASPTD